MVGADSICRLVGIQSQMLLQETEVMLDGEAPQIHAAQVLRRHVGRTGPKQPERAFVARGPIGAVNDN